MSPLIPPEKFKLVTSALTDMLFTEATGLPFLLTEKIIDAYALLLEIVASTDPSPYGTCGQISHL